VSFQLSAEPPAKIGFVKLLMGCSCSAELQLGVLNGIVAIGAELELGATKADSRFLHAAESYQLPSPNRRRDVGGGGADG
jgi:hypothetical protein